MSSALASVVSFHNAAVRRGDSTIWSDVNLTITPGEFVAILGPNGVGKSTLVKAALGLLPLAVGSVAVFGRDPSQARELVGYLPQRRNFDATLRVRGTDLVRLGLDGERWGIPVPFVERFSKRASAARDRVAQVIELVGATLYADRPIGQLSGGEQQRLLIAQALVRRPKLLFLDEPLDSLDLSNQAAIAALIASISATEGVTVVMVAHDVNPILSYLDQVVYVAKGRVLAGATHEVITSERLSALFDTPIEVLRASDGQLVVVGQPEPPSFHSDRHGHAH